MAPENISVELTVTLFRVDPATQACTLVTVEELNPYDQLIGITSVDGKPIGCLQLFVDPRSDKWKLTEGKPPADAKRVPLVIDEVGRAHPRDWDALKPSDHFVSVEVHGGEVTAADFFKTNTENNWLAFDRWIPK